MIVTLTATKFRLRSTVRPMLIPTLGTRLRSMARINTNDSNTLGLCLIRDQLTQTSKGPLVKLTTLLHATTLSIRTYFSQVLNHNRTAWLNTINYAPTNNVIAIRAKPCHFQTQAPQMPLGRTCAFALKPTLQSEVSTFNALPSSFAKEPIIGCDRWASFAKVNTNNRASGHDNGFGQSNNKMEKEETVTINQIGAIKPFGLSNLTLRAVIHLERNTKTTRHGRKASTVILQVEPITAHVVPNRSKSRARTGNLLWFALAILLLAQSKSRHQRFSCTHPSGYNKLRRQLGKLTTQIIIGRFVQRNAVLLAAIPTVTRNEIVASRRLFHGLKQRFFLFWCGLELQTNRSLHTHILSYAERICKQRIVAVATISYPSPRSIVEYPGGIP